MRERIILNMVFRKINHKIIIVNVIVILLSWLLLFVMDIFGDQRHSITDTMDVPNIITCNFENTVNEEFTALSDKLDRVSVCLIGIDENSSGLLNTVITDLNGDTVINKQVSLNKMTNGEYYEQIVAAKLNQNDVYNISFTLEGVSDPQNIYIALTSEKYQNFDTKLYINNELSEGGILLVYDYLMPANNYSKILAFIGVIFLSLLVSAVVVFNKESQSKLGITSLEDTMIEYIISHLSYIIICISIVLGIYARWLFRNYESGDYIDFLFEWYNQIKELGGFKALSTQIGNYGIPYQFLIALFSYLPIKSLYGYKIISCIFDFVTAFGIYKIVKHIVTECDNKEANSKYNDILPSIAFAVSVFFPTAIFNSSCWGQCDSIYTAFIILTIESLIAQKETRAFAFYGISFAFKLQAVFFLPVLILLYFKKRNFSIVNFLIIPLVAMIICTPGYLFGRGLEAVFKIYSSQAGEYPYLSVGYPSVWTFFIDGTLHVSEASVLPFAIIITVIALGLFMTEKLVYIKNIGSVDLVRTSFMVVYTCVFFLPCMHERYSYLYATLGIILLFCDFNFLPQFSMLVIVELLIYGRMLFNTEPVFDQYAHIFNIILYITSIIYYLKCERNTRSCSGLKKDE